LADRPAYFSGLLANIQDLRFKTARPHWIVIDEAHHMLPAELGAGGAAVPKELENFLLVTVHADLVSPAILSSVGGLIAVGPDPQAVIDQFDKGVGKSPRESVRLNSSKPDRSEEGYAVTWIFGNSTGPVYVKFTQAESERRRHRRKYATGELGEDKSFYFRGANGKLNLRAQNMNLFAQLAEGLDDETWSFHLRRTDYSRWLRETIKDEELAEIVGSIEKDGELSSAESRKRIVEAVRKHYTAPA
jgi:hypothetical protein